MIGVNLETFLRYEYILIEVSCCGLTYANAIEVNEKKNGIDFSKKLVK